jgi:hypothetical protein
MGERLRAVRKSVGGAKGGGKVQTKGAGRRQTSAPRKAGGS